MPHFEKIDLGMTATLKRIQEAETRKHNELCEAIAAAVGEFSEEAKLAVLAFKLSDS